MEKLDIYTKLEVLKDTIANSSQNASGISGGYNYHYTIEKGSFITVERRRHFNKGTNAEEIRYYIGGGYYIDDQKRNNDFEKTFKVVD